MAGARQFVWGVDATQLRFVQNHMATAVDAPIITEKQKQEAREAAAEPPHLRNEPHGSGRATAHHTAFAKSRHRDDIARSVPHFPPQFVAITLLPVRGQATFCEQCPMPQRVGISPAWPEKSRVRI